MRPWGIAVGMGCVAVIAASIMPTAKPVPFDDDMRVPDMPAKKQILFVCIENSNRSQMAEAFARIHGGDTVEAFSAGSKPSGRVNPRAIQYMSEVGYDLSTHSSKSLDAFNDRVVDVAVTMGCGEACRLVKAKRREDWQIPDPKSLSADEYRRVRDLIEQKVKDLLKSL